MSTCQDARGDWQWLHAAMLDTLREMMARDADAQVVANCMTVLQQARPAAWLSACRLDQARLRCKGSLQMD